MKYSKKLGSWFEIIGQFNTELQEKATLFVEGCLKDDTVPTVEGFASHLAFLESIPELENMYEVPVHVTPEHL